MAEKRMISKVISISKKFNIRLTDHFSRLMYLLLIPHSDDFGRLTGDPFKVKALILPMMKEVNEEEVEKTLENLDKAELIKWYESDGEWYIQIVNFDDHQQGLHKRTKSKFPEPPNYSRKFPEIPSELNRTELNRTELNRTEEKGTEQKEVEKDLILKRINALGLKCKGEFELSLVYGFMGTMETVLIIESLNRSEHIKKVAYALGILEEWSAKGFTKLEDVKSKRQLQPVSNKEAEIQQRLAEERKNAEPMSFQPTFDAESEIA